MGWKLSMIIIQNPQNFRDEKLLLEKLGFKDYEYQEDTILEECMFPQDKSVNIGYYNGNMIICENIIYGFFTYKLGKVEKALIKIFPDSEIMAVSCLSSTNLHGYSVIKNKTKTRCKVVGTEIGKCEYGELLEEEIKIYNRAIIKNGRMIWQYAHSPNEDFIEEQLMEEFTFRIIKRRLGIYISSNENKELMYETVFRKYCKEE